MGSALVFASGTGSQTGVSDVERKAGSSSSSSSSLHTFGVHVVYRLLSPQDARRFTFFSLSL
jgi:hypothetical protein